MLRLNKSLTLRTILISALCSFVSITAQADCTMLQNVTPEESEATQEDNIVFTYGDCVTRHSPVSTFKIPLALMGFDAKLLADARHPVLEYKKEYNAQMPSWRHDTDPTYWQKESVVWYSQELTTQLGVEQFRKYVNAFGYGNKDLSGKDALTQAWLASTLKISPVEQADFLSRFLMQKLPVSDHAFRMTYAIIPQFSLDNGWTAYGKTGSGKPQDGGNQFGWFIGWARKGSEQIIFVRYVEDKEKMDTPIGPRIRAAFLQELPDFLD